jgi:hypothetical protein
MNNNAIVPVRVISKAEIFARATELGLSPSDDRLERFRKAGLLGDSVPIPGTTQRGCPVPQANRCLFLLALCKTLGKRPRPSGLAFWLCWYGFEDIPPELICEHIDRTLVAFVKTLKREFDRKRVPVKGVRDPKRWEKIGEPFGKSILKYNLRQTVSNRIAQQVFSWIAGLAIRALVSPTSFDAVAGILQRLAFIFKLDKSKPEAMRMFWEMISEGVQLFKLDERKNPLILAVREINATDPKAIIPLVYDTRLMTTAMGSAFPIFNALKAPFPEEPADKTSVYIAKNFSPCMVAAMALTRNFPHSIEMRKQLREGNFGPALQEFHQVKVVTDDIMTKIGIEVKK